MKEASELLIKAVRAPDQLFALGLEDWDLLIRHARCANLLATLAIKIQEENRLEQVPQQVRWHLLAALTLAERQQIAIRYEVNCICNALESVQERIILLKGAAYVMANRLVAKGRTFSDVDIMVPRYRLDVAESELLIHGWQAGKHDEYDQRYYRRWMHEIPPLRHVKRGTTIDVHHSILPDTARIKVQVQPMIDAAIALPGFKNLYVLKPVDMLLHSATHLFHEGNFEKGIRDLFDLDALIKEFGEHPAFWDELVPRANQLGLSRILFYGLRYTHHLLGTKIPLTVLKQAEIGTPNFLILRVMDRLYAHAFRPLHASIETRAAALSRSLLYIRSHFLKMPVHLLMYHLLHKALMKPEVKVEN